MGGVLEGIKVIEVAQYVLVPAAGAILAEWGADVIKIEHPERGDGARGMMTIGEIVIEAEASPMLHHANRGKRSVGIDIESPEGYELLLEMVREADVFLTNLLPPTRAKLKIDVEDLRKVNPRIVYARGSAFGPRGQESEKGGYDMTAFWCRAGTAATIMLLGGAQRASVRLTLLPPAMREQPAHAMRAEPTPDTAMPAVTATHHAGRALIADPALIENSRGALAAPRR